MSPTENTLHTTTACHHRHKLTVYPITARKPFNHLAANLLLQPILARD